MNRKYQLLLLFISVPLLAFSQARSLEFYLDSGLSNSPLLRDFTNQINSATIDSLLIRSSKLPQVEARSQLLYSPVYKNFGYDEVVTDGGNYTGVVGVSQNIFNRKDIDNRFRSVDIQKQIASNSSKISVAELKRIITEQYLVSYADFNELAYNRSFLELAYKECEIVRKFVSGGIARQTDYLALQIETQTQEILVSQIVVQLEKDLRQLNQICGLNDTGFYDLKNPALNVVSDPDLTKSPLFTQYKIDSLRIENEKAAIDIRYRLKMNWFADAGFLTSTPWNFYTHFGYSAGVTLSLPIYDGNQREHEKQKLSLEENSRLAYSQNFKNTYSQKILQLNEEVKSLENLNSRLQNQLSTSEQLVSELRGQLEKGIIQMTEYITALKNFRLITRDLSYNGIRIQLVINEINYLLAQ